MPMSTRMLAISQSCLHLALGLTASPSSPARTRHQTTKSHLSDNRHNTRITTHKDTPRHDLENTKSRNTGRLKTPRRHTAHTPTHKHAQQHRDSNLTRKTLQASISHPGVLQTLVLGCDVRSRRAKLTAIATFANDDRENTKRSVDPRSSGLNS